MNLDLDLLTEGWLCPRDEVCARLVVGYDGRELIQLRVDLGVLQMWPDGRPDGVLYRGCESALDYLRREALQEHEVAPADWQELQRELQQLNYRRLALCAIADTATDAEDLEAVLLASRRAARDIDACMEIIGRLESRSAAASSGNFSLWCALLFSRARIHGRALALSGRFDDAIDTLQQGIESLSEYLAQAGYDEDARENDASLALLRDMERRLRREHPGDRTLRERLDEAIRAEDFEQAARLRDELARRTGKWRRSLPPPR